MFHLFWTYVAANAFMLHVYHEQVWQGGAGEGSPVGYISPHVRVGSEEDTTAGTEHKVISMGVVAGTEHEAASMGGQQAWSRRQSEA
jgi:hypothetical protein